MIPRVVIALLCVLWVTIPAQAANLCVKVGGNNATAKASIVYVPGNESGSTCWQWIGRATWGSTSRASLVTGEAAAAGDTVYIFGSSNPASPTLYTTTESVISSASPVYIFANSGSAGNYITMQAVGYVRLGAPNANAPVVGGNLTYVKWIADRANSRFVITADGRFGTAVNISSSTANGTATLTVNTASAHGLTTGDLVVIRNHNCSPAIGGPPTDEDIVGVAAVTDSDTFTMDTLATRTANGGATGTIRKFHDLKADTTVVNPAPDTGPVVISGTGVWLEGFDIDSSADVDYTDNWMGIRLQSSVDAVIRNNQISTYYNLGHTSNAVGIQDYGAQDCVVENNYIFNTVTALSFKDTAFTLQHSGCRYRFNRGDDLEGAAVLISFIEVELGADIFQNVFTNIGTAYTVARSDFANNVRLVNNSFYSAGFGVVAGQAGSGGLWQNNIVHTAANMIFNDGTAGPTTTHLHFKHGVYHNSTSNFYSATDGTKTIAQWRTDFSPQDAATPQATTTEPLFANAAGADLRLCTAAAAPHASCSGASPALTQGVDVLDLDGDSSTVDTVPAGAHITNSETIGLTSSSSAPRSNRLRITGQPSTRLFLQPEERMAA